MDLKTAFNERTLFAVSAGLAAACLVTLFYGVWQWHSDWVLANQALRKSAAATVTNTAQLIDNIPQAHLFGKSPAGDVPITSLQLQVTGIVKTGSEGASKAYISVAGQPGKIFKVGDYLRDDVKIYAITPDAVILDNNGEFEKLPLPREKPEFKPRAAEGDV